MKRTKKLLAGILASSLAVMSLPFFGLSAVADDAIIDGNETIHTWVDLVTVLTPSENRYNLDRLYHNPETKTAFNYSFEALPHALHFLPVQIHLMMAWNTMLQQMEVSNSQMQK